MKKVLLYGFALIGFTACENAVNNSEIPSVLKNDLLHSVINATQKIKTDSSRLNKTKHFNFFLKEGFAKKFGL
ncbi:MAG TPA: hypothetical protein VGB84_04060 [Arachidicoccus sp.]